MQETSDVNNPLIKVVYDEKKQLLFEAINQLSATKREVLELQYFGDMSQKEIAVVLGLTPANVRVLSFRAKRELKQYLEENGYDFS